MRTAQSNCDRLQQVTFANSIVLKMVPPLCFHHLKQYWAMYRLRLIRKSCLTQITFLDFDTRRCHSSRPPVDLIAINYPAETINGRKYRDNHQTSQITTL
ncbi:unnamed protein product [Coregonus sp. 'balchen']|nr:unnamed protein product [Coregonus sp. 'balchen']